jgi:hypothetical protein
MSYTDSMIAKIEAAQPLDLAIAKKLATELNVSYRSIISKAKQMQFVYVAKVATPKKEGTLNKVTKSDLVNALQSATGIKFVALDKSNTADLIALATYIEQIQHELASRDLEESASL